jgi:predicted nucleotidyltransferase
MRTVQQTPARDPSRVLFGRTRRRVLSWLYGHPGQRYYLRQIVRQSGAAQGAVQRELQLLVEAGLLRRSMEGRHVYFEANSESPIFAELQAILRKTTGLVDVIRECLTPLSDNVELAFVFGSAASGELRSDSDVDVLVVGDVSFSDVANALTEAQVRIGRDVNPAVYPAAEFREKMRTNHHFLMAVLEEPRLFVVGGPDELGRLGAERLAARPPDEPKRDQRPPRRGGSRPGRQRD